MIDVVAATCGPAGAGRRGARSSQPAQVTRWPPAAPRSDCCARLAHRLLAVIANPSFALVLMMIGIYGLLFEFSSPGFVAARRRGRHLPAARAGALPAAAGELRRPGADRCWAWAFLVAEGSCRASARSAWAAWSPSLGAICCSTPTCRAWPSAVADRGGRGSPRGGLRARSAAWPCGRAPARGERRANMIGARGGARPIAGRGGLGAGPGRDSGACAACRWRPASACVSPASTASRWTSPKRTPLQRAKELQGSMTFSGSRPGAAVAGARRCRIRILREYERGVVFQLGRFWKVKGPGLVILVIPASSRWCGWTCASSCWTCRRRT